MTAESGLLTLPGSLTRADLIQAFRLMYLSRKIDDREVLLKRQNKLFFQISGAGHEAIQVAAGMAMTAGHDWFYPYYRDRALSLTLGITPFEMFLQGVGAGADRQSGGRQMPSHWCSRELHIVSTSSCTGTHYTQAVGCAGAIRLLDPTSSAVTLVASGEGATSEGELWESLNIACMEKLPVIFLVEDNGYAISVPVEKQTAGGSVSKLVTGFPNLKVLDCDGTDFLASYAAMHEAVEYCRAGHGPAFVHATTIRPYSHSYSDDEKTYKPAEDREAESRRDPIVRFPEWLLEEGLLTRDELARMVAELDAEVTEASDRALASPQPELGQALRYLYSDSVDPRSEQFSTPARFADESARTMVDTINQTLREEMDRDSRIVVFGEDVADCSREEHLAALKGKGGVFKATLGLQSQFGSDRVFNSPIAEACIVGRANGMAAVGLKPVVEIQFFDYIWPAMMQFRDEVATFRWRSNNQFSCPMVVRVAIGGYLNGGAIYHSQCGESIFTHIPGLRVVFPSNALDACGLLRTAIRCDDPVLFLEHKQLYRETYNRSPHPGKDFLIPFGKANVCREGKSLTIVTYGALVQKSLVAAQQVEQRNPGVSIEVLDLRTLNPYDWEAIVTSVNKTSRVIVAHEDTLSWGYGAEIAARIANELFGHLDAPVGRVGALDTWVAYNPVLEDEILPQVSTVAREMERILAY